MAAMSIVCPPSTGLIMHSREDGLIAFPHAENNFAVANERKMLWEISGAHNEFLEGDRARYLEGLNRFLRRLEATRGPQPSKTTAQR